MEGDASFIETLNQRQSYHHPQQYYPTTQSQEGTSRKRKRKSHYDAILMSYSELLPQLVQMGGGASISKWFQPECLLFVSWRDIRTSERGLQSTKGQGSRPVYPLVSTQGFRVAK
ncbi:hypothetical protein Lal_00017005 [Lupinus albus]|nr:hypothetical protein Lal_00017005 [Lupinus albus]